VATIEKNAIYSLKLPIYPGVLDMVIDPFEKIKCNWRDVPKFD
jgi:hypothetical protein